MKCEISVRLAQWLREAGREDIAKQAVMEISDSRHSDLVIGAHKQHPNDDAGMLHDRAVFRALTNPEWAPTRKMIKAIDHAKRDRWLRYAWAIAVLILLLLLLVQRGHAQPPPVYEAQGSEPIRAEKRLEPSVLTAEQKFRIRDLQHRYDELRLQMAKLELDKVSLEKKLSDALSTINGVAYDLARESKVDTSRWNLNIDNLAWEKRK